MGKGPDFSYFNYLLGNDDIDNRQKMKLDLVSSCYAVVVSSLQSEVKPGQQLLLEASEEALREDKSPMPRCVCGS